MSKEDPNIVDELYDAVNNLKCCGNCKYYSVSGCPAIYCDCVINQRIGKDIEYYNCCDKWECDNINHVDRLA